MRTKDGSYLTLNDLMGLSGLEKWITIREEGTSKLVSGWDALEKDNAWAKGDALVPGGDWRLVSSEMKEAPVPGTAPGTPTTEQMEKESSSFDWNKFSNNIFGVIGATLPSGAKPTDADMNLAIGGAQSGYGMGKSTGLRNGLIIGGIGLAVVAGIFFYMKS